MRFLRTPLLTCLLTGTVMVTNAFAQETAEYVAPCEASKMTKADVDRAHTVFLSGKQFLEESNYDKAISYFKDAYAIDCSIHAILPIIATAYERKGDKAAAIRALQEYVKRAPSALDHEVIERRIKNLTDQLSHEQPAPPPAPSASLPVAPAASVSPAAQTPFAQPAASTLTLTAPVPVAAVVEIRSARASNPGPWIVVGLGGAAVVGSIVLYAIGIPDVTNAARACPDRKGCSTNVANEGNDGRFLEAAGGVIGSLGLAAIGGGLLWYFLSQRSTDHGTVPVPTVSLAPGYAGVTVANTF